MSIGTSLFLATLVTLAVWQIGRHQKWGLVGKWLVRVAGFGIVASLVVAGISWIYVSVQSETQRRGEVEQARREEAALSCLANDVPRMENAVRDAGRRITHDMSLAAAKTELERATSTTASTQVSRNSIRDLVVVTEVRTECDSGFRLLVNVVASNPNGLPPGTPELHSLTVWPHDAPTGYSIPALSVDYDVIRSKRREQKARPRSPTAGTAVAEAGDHCALNLSQEARLQRLAQFGEVRQRGFNEYRAGAHYVTFLSSGVLYSCW